MKTQSIQKILEHYDRVITLGEKVKATRRGSDFSIADFVDMSIANQWFTSSLSLIAHTLGEDSEHYTAMKRLYVEFPKWLHVDQAFGVLIAAKDDVENGALFNTKALITAEVFDDILEQGKVLLDAGYYAPAAVVIGCVLEDSLRKLCGTSGIVITDKTKLDTMNSELVKAGTYNKLTQKKITALADIRNSAAHGKWDEFDKNDVEDVLRWTRNFIENFFS